MHTEMTADLPPRPVRVLHLTISFARGGRRDAILTLARAGRTHGITPFLATLRGEPGEVAPYQADFEATTSLALTGTPSLRQVYALRDQCRRWQVDVVHSHDASSQFVASMLRCVAPSLHILMTFHRSLGFESAGWRNRVRNAITLPLVHRVLTASEERRRHFLAENLIRASKVETIPLGIDLERFRPNPESRKAIRAELGLSPRELLLVSAGHFGEEKGLDQALAVAKATQDARPELDFHLAIMGTGSPDRVAVIHQLGREALGDRVHFLGQRPDPERIFAAADLVLHTPRLEAFGLVVVQAMASGAPVAAAGVGGIPEIIQDGQTGVLLPIEDVAASGAVIGDLLADSGRRTMLAATALGRAREQYPAARFAARHAALYRRLARSS